MRLRGLSSTLPPPGGDAEGRGGSGKIFAVFQPHSLWRRWDPLCHFVTSPPALRGRRERILTKVALRRNEWNRFPHQCEQAPGPWHRRMLQARLISSDYLPMLHNVRARVPLP